MCLQEKLTECEALIPGHYITLTQICDAGSDGFFASWSSFGDACLHASDKHWKNYWKAWMGCTNVSYKTLIRQTGNLHTASSNVSQSRLALFMSRSSQISLCLISMQGKLQHTNQVGAQEIWHAPYCPHASVCLPLSKSGIWKLYNSLTFQ